MIGRVFAAIVFSAQQVGQATSFAPDYGKAKVAAIRLFKLLDQKPAIECSDAKGKHLVMHFIKELLLF